MEYAGSTEFVHLHCHTVYSMLDGIQTPEQIMATCKQRGWKAVAITEHGHMSSVPDNYFAAAANGIKYIVGSEIYYNDFEPLRQKMVADGQKLPTKLTNEDLYLKIRRNRHLTALCMNDVGFHNLVGMTTEAWATGMYYKPRIWLEKLQKYNDGLIILSGCLNGPVSHELDIKNHQEAIKYIAKFRDIFNDRFYIELQMPCLPDKDDKRIFWLMLTLAKKLGIEYILTNDAHYQNKKDFETQKLMMAIDQDLTIDSPELFHVNSNEQYFKTRAELYETFKTRGYCDGSIATDAEFEVMCDNTIKVAERCSNFKPDTAPKIPTNSGDVQLLKESVMRALVRRGLHNNPKKYTVDNRSVTYLEQARIELDRFIEKGFASYFIITQDFIRHGVENGWPFGPRGSVGGSLVCYLLGIHELDPLKWGLSFDRFLSPSRGGNMLNIKAE